MKAELKNDYVWLEGETEEEIYFLDVLYAGGVRAFGRSTSGISICSPKLANLLMLELNMEQRAILSHAIGIEESLLYPKAVVGMTSPTGNTFKNTAKMISNLESIKNQLFNEPEYPQRTMVPPTAPPVKKTRLVKEDEKE